MKRIILIIMMCFPSLWLSCQQKNSFKSVDADAFEKAVADSSYVVLDVRTAAEYAEGHIPGTDFNIDVLESGFEDEAQKVIPKGKPVALYCRSGNRSKTAARILVSKGYDVVELAPGYNGWASSGKDVESVK